MEQTVRVEDNGFYLFSFHFSFLFSFLFIFLFLDLGLGDSVTSFLLSLVPPSCMVAPIRDLGNKFTSFSSNTIPLQTFELPTVSHSNNTEIDIFTGSPPDNYDEVRGRSLSTKRNISRDSSMSSLKSSITYHEKMELNNAMNVNVDIDDNSPVLSYKTSQKKVL